MKPLLYSQMKMAKCNNVTSADFQCSSNKALHYGLYFPYIHMVSEALPGVWLRISSIPDEIRVMANASCLCS